MVTEIRETTRLFVALWPTDTAREGLARWRDAWRWPADAAPVASEQFHLTLHFIGDVARSRLDALTEGLRAPFVPFELTFGRPAFWPHGIAVLEPDTVPLRLLELHAALEDRLQGLSLPIEDRTFRPHVTLARHATPALPSACPPARWQVRDYALVELRSERGGGYRVLQRYA